jgi:hypothetical protein
MPYRYRYDPNQPRVPAGHSDGGQWTDTGAGKHAWSMTDVSGQARRLPRLFPIPPIKPSPFFELGARAPLPRDARAAVKDVESAIALYNELSLHNSPEQRTIIAFKARDYVRTEAPVLELLRLGVLTQSEVNLIVRCRRAHRRDGDAANPPARADAAPLISVPRCNGRWSRRELAIMSGHHSPRPAATHAADRSSRRTHRSPE